MICKRCANIFDDSLLACPDCGWSMNTDSAPEAPKRTEPFKLNINFDEKMPEYKGFESTVDVNEAVKEIVQEVSVSVPSYPGEEEKPTPKKALKI